MLPVNRPALKAPLPHSMFSQEEQLKKTVAWERGKRLIGVQQNDYRPPPKLPQGRTGDRAGEETQVCPVSWTGSFWGRKEVELSNSFARSVNIHWGLVVCQPVVLSPGIQPGQRRPKQNKRPNKQTKAHHQSAHTVMEIDRHETKWVTPVACGAAVNAMDKNWTRKVVGVPGRVTQEVNYGEWVSWCSWELKSLQISEPHPYSESPWVSSEIANQVFLWLYVEGPGLGKTEGQVRHSDSMMLPGESHPHAALKGENQGESGLSMVHTEAGLEWPEHQGWRGWAWRGLLNCGVWVLPQSLRWSAGDPTWRNTGGWIIYDPDRSLES